MFEAELQQLEARVQALIAAYQQLQLERQHAIHERDHLQSVNTQLRAHIVGIVERLRALESAELPQDAAP